MKRYELERAVEHAALPGPAKGILFVLCARISARDGSIPDRYQPSLSMLAAHSGYSRSTVMRHLNGLERDGWVARDRPEKPLSRAEHLTTAYTMSVPEGYPQARVTRHRGLGSRGAMARVTADQELGSPAATELGSPAAPIQKRRQKNVLQPRDDDDDSQSELVDIARRELAALTGREVPYSTAAEAVRLVLDGRAVASPAAYLRRALRDQPRRYLPAASGPPNVRDLGPDGQARPREKD
jgi:hypothetical protein